MNGTSNPPLDGADTAALQALLAARAAHWRRSRMLTGALLLLWLVTGFATAFYARQLATLTLFGWPLSFYLAAQGASLIYLGILGGYALFMRRLDRRFAQRLAQHDASAAVPESRPA